MAYSDIALLSADQDFSRRVAACHASEIPLGTPEISSEAWAGQHAWTMAAAPGFGDAYASAIAGSVERPGNDPAVISDEQILSAVQAIMTAEEA